MRTSRLGVLVTLALALAVILACTTTETALPPTSINAPAPATNTAVPTTNSSQPPTSTPQPATNTAAPPSTTLPSATTAAATAVASSTPAGPQWGNQTKTSGCAINGPYPDPACTPGDIFPTVTAAQVCVSGYSASVRDVPSSEKDAVYTEYGITSHSTGQYEVDHFVPLELGGSNDISNLWPEPADPTPGFHQKDVVENYLHAQVCNGAMTLTAAQVLIAMNWLAVFTGLPTPTLRPTVTAIVVIVPSDTPVPEVLPTATEAPTLAPADTPTQQIAPTDTPVPPPTAAPTSGGGGGARVRTGATCNDNTSSTATGSGACSHHGGVRCWNYSDGSCTKP